MNPQSRTPAGVPTGGQFAASARTESGVTLDAPTPKPVVKKAADYDPDSPKYDVEVDGRKIGTVGRGWFRNGGTQWFNSVRGVLYPVGDTRAAAVAHLVRHAPDPSDWTDKFPQDSAAANVAAFKGKPVGVWFNDGNHRDGHGGDTGPASYIAPDGSYAVVWPDDEPTGHWFIDGAWADGSDFDGGCLDGRPECMRSAETTLRAGKTAYEAEQASW